MTHNLPQPRHELESLLFRHVLATFGDQGSFCAMVWAEQAVASSDGIPELALQEIADLNNSSLEVAWSCDVASSSKKWRLTQLCTICLESRMALLLVSRKGLTMKVSVGWVSLSTWFRCPLRVGRVDP